MKFGTELEYTLREIFGRAIADFSCVVNGNPFSKWLQSVDVFNVLNLILCISFSGAMIHVQISSTDFGGPTGTIIIILVSHCIKYMVGEVIACNLTASPVDHV